MTVIQKYMQFLTTRQAKRKLFTACFLIYFSITHLLAIENNGRGVKAIGMANACVAFSNSVWAICYNPAGLAQLQNISCSFFVVPEQFGLTELRTIACAIGLPNRISTLALNVEQFGFELYRETVFGLALARMIDQHIALGICFNLTDLGIHTYGSIIYYSIDAGLMVEIARQINFGFSLKNVYCSKKGNSYQDTPRQGSIGICWNPLVNMQLSLEIEKDVRYPLSLKTGVEQKILEVIELRMGVADNPSKYSIGIGIVYSPIEFGYAGYSHPDLDWTHQIELTIILGK